jgi:TolB-like protein/Flp pilus assembly protein TadD
LNETPEPLARYKSDVPSGLQRIVDKALAKERDKRYQHADEMATDLRSAAANLSGSGGAVRRRSRLPWVAAAVAFILAVILILLFYPKSQPQPVIGKSIAVLPFKNLSDSKEDEYFSDGLTEDIITQLSKISGIEKVIARTSVMRYKGSAKSIRDVGRELDVATVLEGSVRRAGNQVRIVAQLIDAHSEGHLWADTYDKEMTQIFAIQSDVAQRIAAALKAKLAPGEKEKIEKIQTQNTEAYQLYLKGRFHWKKRNREGFVKAIQYFNQAIEKDPSFALAYSGLADAYITQTAYFFLSPKEAGSKAREAVLKALTLDPSLAEPHTSLASLYEIERDWAKAEKEYQRAMELNPNYATGRQWYGEYLAEMGRFDEALIELEKAQELDPLSPILFSTKGSILAGMHRYDEGIEQAMKALEIDPNFSRGHSVLGLLYFLKGEGDAAIREHKKAVELSGGSPEHTAYLGWTYGLLGQKEEAGKILREFLSMSKLRYVPSYLIGALYLSIGEEDQAFAWFNEAIENHEQAMLYLKFDPTLNPIRKDPRFSELLKKMGLHQ